jgi:hypothetical protein
MVVGVTTFYALNYNWLSSDKTAVDTDRFMHYISATVEANIYYYDQYPDIMQNHQLGIIQYCRLLFIIMVSRYFRKMCNSLQTVTRETERKETGNNILRYSAYKFISIYCKALGTPISPQ